MATTLDVAALEAARALEQFDAGLRAVRARLQVAAHELPGTTVQVVEFVIVAGVPVRRDVLEEFLDALELGTPGGIWRWPSTEARIAAANARWRARWR